MFTGIVEERGRVRALEPHRLAVTCTTVASDAELGSSIAVNGCCLTVVERGPDRLAFDLSEETLRRTTFGRLRPGDPVNLERPLTLSSRLGGHLVQGHVDGVGTVVSIDPEDTGGAWMTIEAPTELRRYLALKGSVAVDGVSLTVAALELARFSVALIPHTMAVTTLGAVRVGDVVNLEVDVIARYVEALMDGRRT